MTEPKFVLEGRLAAITRVQEALQHRLNRLSGKSPDRAQLSDKLHHAILIGRLLKAELGIGPAPTHVRTGYVGGVKIVFPHWEATDTTKTGR